MKSVFQERENCNGCTACEDVCPVSAIEMNRDKEGFLYPAIDEKTCVDCGLCAAICPVRHKGHYKLLDEPRFFAAKHKNEDVLRKSASGGAFTALSDVVLDGGGVIYGADFDESFHVLHKRAEIPEQRNRMRFSKYVQSDLNGVYKQIESDLKKGIPVLFTGTPCQTAGMRARFRNPEKSKGLVLCDLICHSIPSPKIWEDYTRLLEAESNGTIAEIRFRSKRHAWSRENSNKGFSYRVKGSDDFKEDDRFYNLFLKKNYIVRPSCYACKFTDKMRTGDITIADYFGIEKFAPALYDPLGVSLIMVSSQKGRDLLNKAARYMHIEERPASEALSQQNRLSLPGEKPPARETFWARYYGHGLAEVLKYADGEFPK